MVSPPSSAAEKETASSDRPLFRPGITLLVYGLAILTSLICIQLSNVTIHEPDALYHFAHAQIYASRGLFFGQFPWMSDTIFTRHPGDQWYGFHLLLIPFTFIGDRLIGLQLATSVVGAASCLLVFAALKILDAPVPYFWSTLYLFGSADEFSRLMSCRPQSISMGLFALFFAALVTRRYWLLAIVCGLIAWIHLTLFWLIFIIGGVYTLANALLTKKADWKWLPLSFLGIFIGWILRPHPANTGYILYVQLADLLIVRLHGIHLSEGTELRQRLSLAASFLLYVPLWIALAGQTVTLLTIRKKLALSKTDWTVLLSLTVLTAVFYLGAVRAASRCADEFVLFGTLLAAQMSILLRSVIEFSFVKRIICTAASIAVAAVGLYEYTSNPLLRPLNFAPMTQVGLWLEKNTAPGDIVFHADWSQFSELFFYDTKNHFIAGMDPIFEYAHSPQHYFERETLSLVPNASVTTYAPIGQTGPAESTYTVLVSHFHAKYVVVWPRNEPHFFRYLWTNPHYQICYANGDAAVFKIR